MPSLNRQYRVNLLIEASAIQYDYSSDESIKQDLVNALNNALLNVKSVLYFSKVSQEQ